MAEQESVRILHWAEVVRKLDKAINDGFLMATQTDKMKLGLLEARYALRAIYDQLWGEQNIGYPNVVTVMQRWNLDTERLCTLSNPAATLRTINLLIESVKLDVLAIKTAQANAEAGVMYAPEEFR